ncbi:hypothetical protein DPEC_G00376490 [Dallia pectoralis]|nr:hypothetical protein DPEC_G00376490 [Dallia pectoralis]
MQRHKGHVQSYVFCEAEFILVTAIAGGLFGVNRAACRRSSYHVINQHYQGLWAHGSIGYDGSNCGAIGGTQFGSPCAHGARKTLVQKKTTEYMLSNQAVDGIQTYLEINQIYTREDLTSLLMQDNRWLSTEEVTFMLNAYGKLSTMITEHSYPIFDPNRTHFEPVTHV